MGLAIPFPNAFTSNTLNGAFYPLSISAYENQGALGLDIAPQRVVDMCDLLTAYEAVTVFGVEQTSVHDSKGRRPLSISEIAAEDYINNREIDAETIVVTPANLKRLLAFSSIAQAGFILVGMSVQSAAGETSVIYFILIYLFSNLGAFGVITLVSARTGKEELSDYAGFYKTNPFLTWILALSLFSLAGIPPAAGFFGKFFLLMAGAAKENYLLLVIAALNMVVSLYYYLVVIKVMFTSKNDHPIEHLPTGIVPLTGFIICMAGVVLTGLYGDVYNYIYSLVR